MESLWSSNAHNITTMLLTESLGWNGIQILKSRLTGRLAKFVRNTKPDSRPHKLQNDATFFEIDLRYVLTATPVVVEFSEHDYADMDQMARDLLKSLNDMVNGDLIGPLEEARIGAHDLSLLGDSYPRLTSLIGFLDASTDQFNLMTGLDAFIFRLPEGQAGNIAMERISKLKAFLERVMADTQKSQGFKTISQPKVELPEDFPNLELPRVHEKRASVVVNTIFNEFRQLSCPETHEIKLRVSDEWQTGPSHTTLDMFLSCCSSGNTWQEAKCGTFHQAIDETEKDSICGAIQRANEQGRTLYLFVDQTGLFDISDKMPLAFSRLDQFVSESLSELLDQQAFIRITPRDYLKGAAIDKVGSQEKANLALQLARCLMDFFDEDLELASYSWKPEAIYFLRSAGTHTSNRALYISLKPNPPSSRLHDLLETVRPGNPVLLSFARLLLEIDSGEKIPITIHPESRANVSTWGEMCDFVNVAGREGSSNYLRAVEGCLYLHMALPKSQAQPGLAASELLRRAIYEQIVRNLELMMNPQNLKRKRQDSLSEIPPEKKIPISSSSNIQSRGTIPSLSSQNQARPSSRDEFEIAIICALPREYDAMYLLLDEVWEGGSSDFGRVDGDPNIYTAGRIGKFNMVLVLLPGMGKASAAGSSVSLHLSYPGLSLVLLTGICGGVPYPGGDEELLLGDVVISRHIVQYDFGKQYPDSFHVRDTAEDAPRKAPQKIRNLLALFETAVGRERLEKSTALYLQEIQKSAAPRRRGAKYKYPGTSQDKLFQSDYQHKHHLSPQCVCAKSHQTLSKVCEESRQLSCDDLGCDEKYLVQRERLKSKQQPGREGPGNDMHTPSIFIGRIASGDSVMKSGEDRDKIAKRHRVIAFEMEGAGLWDEVPCIVVKSVCDYADSHKNKVWQDFAAASAASAAKALLKEYIGVGRE